MTAHIARANAQQFDYADLMRQLQEHQAAWDAATGLQRRFDVDGGYIWQNPGDPFYDQAVDPRGDRNSFDNGQTGNLGTSYYYNPTTQTFRVSQGDATSGIQNWDVTPSGTTDLGFEHIDRKGKVNRQFGTMVAIAASVLGAGALAQAWAAGSGLSAGAQGAFVASSEQLAANAAWASGGAAEVAGGAGASALESGGLLGAAGGAAEVAGGAGASALSGSAPAAGSLTMEGILGSNYALPGEALTGELGSGVMYGAPTTMAGATSAMTTGAATGPLLESGLSGAQLMPAAANAMRPNQQNSSQSLLERLMNGESMNAQDVAGLLSGVLGARNQYNFGQALLDRAAEATPNRGFYEGLLRQTYENPGAYLQSPEYQAAQDIVHNKLQRSDAAGGRLANDIGRQTTLQNHALSSLGQYRQGLSGIVGQNQNAFTGANSMYTAGQAANNSWSNGILYPLLQQGT